MSSCVSVGHPPTCKTSVSLGSSVSSEALQRCAPTDHAPDVSVCCRGDAAFDVTFGGRLWPNTPDPAGVWSHTPLWPWRAILWGRRGNECCYWFVICQHSRVAPSQRSSKRSSHFLIRPSFQCLLGRDIGPRACWKSHNGLCAKLTRLSLVVLLLTTADIPNK